MSEEFKARVGLNIQACRKKAELTQKQLAKKIGLSEGTISKYESGNIKYVDIEMVTKIATALSCDPNDITGWKSEEQLPIKEEFCLSETEKQIIMSYRMADEIGKAVVLRSLGINEEAAKNKSDSRVG